MKSSRAMSILKWAFLVLIAMYFAVPMLAMARFAFQNVPTVLLTSDTLLTGWSLGGLWSALSNPKVVSATWISLWIAVFAIAMNFLLLVPLAIVTEVRSPRMRPVLTALTLVPWVVPPVALVVGVSATFRAAAPWFLANTLCLVPFYALWAMPFTYRVLDNGLQAMGARTLFEAARGLGAPLWTVILRVIMPNMRAALVAAAMLTTALVLGEYAFASLLLKSTLPTQMLVYAGGDPRGGLALALFVLVVTAVCLGIVVRLMRKRGVSLPTTGF